jgi:Heat induced stress protein YflT
MTSVNNIVVGIFNTHVEAEQSVKELQQAGFDMTKLSIVAKNPHAEEHVVGFYNAGDRIKHWGKAGAFWGSIWGMLFGSAFFVIPGIGPLLVAGPLVAWMVGALEGAVVMGGMSAVGAGLFSIGVPKDSILDYELALKTDKFLVMAHGTAEDAARARDILKGTHPAELHLHSLQQATANDREHSLATV